MDGDFQKVFPSNKQLSSSAATNTTKCDHCSATRVEQKEDKESEEIPQEIWDLIPPYGNYLKKIMQFSGYVRQESIIKLKDRNELENMFIFARSMQDIVENKDEVFGIFSKNPNKVTILPGLQPTFDKFLDAVEQLYAAKESQAGRGDDRNPKLSKHKDLMLYTETRKCIDIDGLKTRMEDWISKQEASRDALLQMGLRPENTFSISEVNEMNDLLFQCLICKRRIAMQTSKGTLSLSNAQRHILKRCWLNTTPKKDPKPFKPDTPLPSFPTLQRPDPFPPLQKGDPLPTMVKIEPFVLQEFSMDIRRNNAASSAQQTADNNTSSTYQVNDTESKSA